MSREERITCDQCGAVKKETNHWFKALEDGLGCFYIWRATDLGPDLAEDEETEGLKDICGHQCAIAALNQFLQTGKLNTEKIEEKA